MKNFMGIIRNNRGIAIITAILALAFMTYLATEVTYDATVEYAVGSQDVKRLKAYYAARAGVEVSLLRIKAYQQVVKRLGKDAGSYPMINMIWQFPLQWPLAMPTDVNLSLTDKQNIQESGSESFFDANFDTQISDEGSKIDLNDLVSPSKVLRENARRQLLNIFNNEIENNKFFESKYRNFRMDELINQMADFMSEKRDSLNGGDKYGPYSSTEYQGYPPSRGFRTVAELKVLPLMEEAIYKLLEKRVTTFGLKGINPNTASKEVLMSIDIGITSEVADKLIARRTNDNEGGEYKSAQDFWNAVNQFGGRLNINPDEVPIVVDSLVSFHVKSTGVYSNVRSTIEVVVVDIDRVAKRITEYVKKENPTPGPAPAPAPPGFPAPAPAPGPAASPNIPQGAPRILYWIEY